MPFEDVEEVGRGEREPLVQEVADVPFLFSCVFPDARTLPKIW